MFKVLPIYSVAVPSVYRYVKKYTKQMSLPYATTPRLQGTYKSLYCGNDIRPQFTGFDNTRRAARFDSKVV